MTFPQPPAKGQPIRAELIRQIIDCLRMFRPLDGQNIRTQTTPGGTIINGTPGGASAAYGTLPWTVRRHVTDDDDDGKWEIWLPTGCMAVGETLTPINLAASEVSGHDDDKPGWYLIKLDEDEGSAQTTTTGSGDDAVTTVSRTWDIIAHAKTSAKMNGVDELNASARRLLYVSARKRRVSGDSAQTDEERVANTWGDEFSQIVATVTIGTRQQGQGAAQPFRKIEQTASAPISVQGKEAAGFDLVWYFSVDTTDGGLSVARLFCVRAMASAAGMSLSGPEMTEIALDAQKIYAKILTNPISPASVNGQIEVVADPQNATADNFLTWLWLYNMQSNAVEADYRAAALANIQVYR